VIGDKEDCWEMKRSDKRQKGVMGCERSDGRCERSDGRCERSDGRRKGVMGDEKE